MDTVINVEMTLSNIPFSDHLKKTLASFVDFIKNNDAKHCNTSIIGCPNNLAISFLSAIALELKCSLKTIDFKDATIRQGDLMQIITNLKEGDILIVLNPEHCSFLDLMHQALTKQEVRITLGKGASEKTFDLPIPNIIYAIVANDKSKIPFSLIEGIFNTLDLSKFKTEFRRNFVISSFEKYSLTVTENVIQQLVALPVSEQMLTTRLLELRNLAYQSNLTTITEQLLVNGSDNIPEIEEVNIMDGREFELFSGDLFRALGYTNVIVTQSSGDFGADVIAEKDDVRFAVQCKRYSAPVGVSAVQEVLASKSLHDCHVACILTNNTFTPAAEELARKNLVVLWGGNKLKEFIDRAKS